MGRGNEGKYRHLEGHSDGVASVAFSPDGKNLAAGVGDAFFQVFFPELSENTVKLWDLTTVGQALITNLATLEGRTENGHIRWRFHPMGHCWLPDQGIKRSGYGMWLRQRMLLLCSAMPEDLKSIRWRLSPDGKLLASGIGG